MMPEIYNPSFGLTLLYYELMLGASIFSSFLYLFFFNILWRVSFTMYKLLFVATALIAKRNGNV